MSGRPSRPSDSDPSFPAATAPPPHHQLRPPPRPPSDPPLARAPGGALRGRAGLRVARLMRRTAQCLLRKRKNGHAGQVSQRLRHLRLRRRRRRRKPALTPKRRRSPGRLGRDAARLSPGCSRLGQTRIDSDRLGSTRGRHAGPASSGSPAAAAAVRRPRFQEKDSAMRVPGAARAGAPPPASPATPLPPHEDCQQMLPWLPPWIRLDPEWIGSNERGGGAGGCPEMKPGGSACARGGPAGPRNYQSWAGKKAQSRTQTVCPADGSAGYPQAPALALGPVSGRAGGWAGQPLLAPLGPRGHPSPHR
jgi:hypothetical protein